MNKRKEFLLRCIVFVVTILASATLSAFATTDYVQRLQAAESDIAIEGGVESQRNHQVHPVPVVVARVRYDSAPSETETLEVLTLTNDSESEELVETESSIDEETTVSDSNEEDIESNLNVEATTGVTENAEETEELSEESSVTPYFGEDGLLVEMSSDRAQTVINHLMAIPGHANGAWYHQQSGVDYLIDELTVEECVWVLHRIEGAGFGQTGDGYAGYDTPESHQVFMDHQIWRRFDGSIKALLKSWGTYSYSGY